MSSRPLNFQQLPTSFAELVDPGRTALVMWDMQKGLAGNAPDLATLKPAAALLLAAAEKADVRRRCRRRLRRLRTSQPRQEHCLSACLGECGQQR